MLSVDQVSGNGNPIMSEKNEKKIKRYEEGEEAEKVGL